MNAIASPLDTLDTLYTAALKACTGLSMQQRIVAESRYCQSLEQQLGGPAGVAQAYLAWCTAAQSQVVAISTGTASLAHIWAEAAERAREDGLRDVDDHGAMFFEVRLS